MNEPGKDFILCADDFAQSEAISTAIMTLAAQHRINAISCLVNMPSWPEMQQELRLVQSTVFTGLHLNLTFGQALSAAWRMRYGDFFGGLPALIKQVYCGQLDLAVVTAEIQAQIDLFTQDMHVYPDFIDGHQHVHQFPVISDALIAIYQQQHSKGYGYSALNAADSAVGSPCFLRKTYNGWQDFFSIQGCPKSQFLAILGGRRWQKKLAAEDIQTNSSFAGLYRFGASDDYRKYFRRFLAKTMQGGLIMCHPGYSSEDPDDPIALFRHYELNYFTGDEFIQDLEDNAMHLLRKQHSE